jgi:peptidoglycan/xylan/chitin deacetylase (PgdA/CDA1 family)
LERRIRDLMKKYLFALLHWTRAINLVSWVNRKRVPIICYHSVTSDAAPVHHDPHKQHLPLRLFLRQLDFLKGKYNVISLSDYVAARRANRELPDYSIILTFDDGFEDFYSVVAPQLRERQMPATVFVITDRAFGRFVPNGETFLDWKQVRELADAGIEIGSHSCSHVPLTELSLEEAAKELSESRTLTETHIGVSPVSLSYPFGQTSSSISALAESLGYACAIASDAGPNANDASIYQLSRTVIASDDNVSAFAARVSGLTWWISRCKRVFRSEAKVSWKPSFRQYGSTGPEFYVD